MTTADFCAPGGILVADAEPLFRSGLRYVLNQTFAAHALREAGTAAELMALVSRQPPALVVLTTNLPDTAGELPQLLTDLRAAQPQLAILALLEPAAATELTILRLVRQRISGLLPRAATPSEVSEAVAAVLQGGQHYAAWTFPCLPDPASGLPPAPAIFTPRQLEVLRLVADDHSNEDIAEYLGMSVRTVEYHRSQMLHKTGTRTTLALVLFARRRGWLCFAPVEATESAGVPRRS
ncbi:response regulator transcription factor [Hymenobacter persicinus]|uniref:response regulator transcription factor n=1 Tax=Hymenobacter persicinus TaxID=2025506 RepID=UPI0013EBFCE4|nr:response regulator transcription factor [Hymenobacter persicinus]